MLNQKFLTLKITIRLLNRVNFGETYSIDNAFDRDINDPRILEKITREEVSDNELRKSILIVTSIEVLIKPIEEYFKVVLLKYIHTVQVQMKLNLLKSLQIKYYHILKEKEINNYIYY